MSVADRPRADLPSLANRQRGAIGLFGILTLLLGLIFAALAIDTGRLWMERRQLQSIADMAALEAAGTIGCAAANDLAAVPKVVDDALKRNSGHYNKPGVVLEEALPGRLQTIAGERRFTTAGTGKPHSVYVHVSNSVPTSLVLGGLFGGQVTLRAYATARAEPPQAAFRVGSGLVEIDTEKSALLNLLLGGLLGTNLNLDVASYQGLADAKITLLDLLKVDANVASVNQLLDANLKVKEVIDRTEEVLHDVGLHQVAVAVNKLVSNTVGALDVRLGDILSVATPDTNAAANVGINVLDLITATLMIANKDHAVQLPLGVNIPGLANLSAELKVIEPPQLAIGPACQNPDGTWQAQAKTAQIKLDVTANINALGLASIDFKLGLEAAQGSAYLESLDIEPGHARAVIQATPGIAKLTLTDQAETGPAKISLLFKLIDLARISLNLPIQPANPTPLIFDVSGPLPDPFPPIKQEISSQLKNLGDALKSPNALDIELLYVPGLGSLLETLTLGIVDLDEILDAVLNQVLSPLLSLIGELLLDPLLDILGIKLGTLDVWLDSIEYGSGAQLVSVQPRL